MATEKKVSMNIQEGIDFYAHETSVNFSPTQVVLDFKSITPRVDPRMGADPIVVLRHNVVLIEPLHAKKLAELLTDVVKKYETNFGKIEKSKAQVKHEKKLKRQTKTKSPKISAPAYFG
jgi:hypothetical protein